MAAKSLEIEPASRRSPVQWLTYCITMPHQPENKKTAVKFCKRCCHYIIAAICRQCKRLAACMICEEQWIAKQPQYVMTMQCYQKTLGLIHNDQRARGEVQTKVRCVDGGLHLANEASVNWLAMHNTWCTW